MTIQKKKQACTSIVLKRNAEPTRPHLFEWLQAIPAGFTTTNVICGPKKTFRHVSGLPMGGTTSPMGGTTGVSLELGGI